MANQKGQGRKKTPTALVGIDGAKLRKDEPKPARATVRMPVGMCPRAQREWRRLAPDLIAKGLLTVWDVALFVTYCDAVADYEAARAEVAEKGRLIPGAHGNWVTNPAVRIQREAAETIRRVGGLFGLNPSDRAGLRAVVPKTTGLAEFIGEPVGGPQRFL